MTKPPGLRPTRSRPPGLPPSTQITAALPGRPFPLVGFGVWLYTVLAFAFLYWILDGGGPDARLWARRSTRISRSPSS